MRPKSPKTENKEVYECGEPTIGSSFVQFDLRFYVVALLFIIFDVEVAFFFPWANVFGKATNLMDPNLRTVASQGPGDASKLALTPAAVGLYRELGVPDPTLADIVSTAKPATGSPAPKVADAKALAVPTIKPASPAVQAEQAIQADANRLALMSIADIGVFFAVLLVGFAYVWRRGDLDWVRAVSRERAAIPDSPPAPLPLEQHTSPV